MPILVALSWNVFAVTVFLSADSIAIGPWDLLAARRQLIAVLLALGSILFVLLYLKIPENKSHESETQKKKKQKKKNLSNLKNLPRPRFSINFPATGTVLVRVSRHKFTVWDTSDLCRFLLLLCPISILDSVSLSTQD